MFAIEKANPGFENYGMALWWTAMRVITPGAIFGQQPLKAGGLTLILSLFGYAVFGYVTATSCNSFCWQGCRGKRYDCCRGERWGRTEKNDHFIV